MAVQHSSGNLSDAVKIHYDKKLIEHAERTVAFYQVAEKRPIPMHGGKTIDFTIVNPLATGGKITEGTNPTVKALSADKIQLTLHQLGDFVQVSDYVDETAITSIVGQAILKLREQSAATIDTFIGHSLYNYRMCAGVERSSLGGMLYNTAISPQTGTGDTHVLQFSTGQASYDGFPILHDKTRRSGLTLVADTLASTALSVKTIRDAVAFLRTRNIKPFADGMFVGITHPEAIQRLSDGAAWKSWNQYTNPQAMYNGEVGKIEGVRFIQAANYNKWTLSGDTITSSVSSALYATLIVGKGAYGVTEMGGLRQYVTRPNNYDSSNPLGLWSTVGWQVKMAACTLNKSAGVIVLSTEK